MFASLRSIYRPLKRMADFVSALVLLTLLAVPMLLVWVLVRVTSAGPGLFWSARVGKDSKIFQMPKFRTMTVCSKVMSRELATDQDIKFTPVGRFLRRTSIDELPQIWSVLLGHMSFIGPRPVLPCDEAAFLRSHHANVLQVRPGITGLAQINGRNYVNPRNKVRYDVFYVRRLCLMLDVKIALGTLRVLGRSDLVK